MADYYAIPGHITRVTDLAVIGTEPTGNNSATITGNTDAITIAVTEASGNCPPEYKASQSDEWRNDVYTKAMD